MQRVELRSRDCKMQTLGPRQACQGQLRPCGNTATAPIGSCRRPISASPSPLFHSHVPATGGPTVACSASPNSTQPAPPAPGGPSPKSADWSKRLLAVAKKTKAKNSPPPADIFTPAPKPALGRIGPGGEVLDLDPEDDLELEAAEASGSGRKRIPAEMRCFDTARIYIKVGRGPGDTLRGGPSARLG